MTGATHTTLAPSTPAAPHAGTTRVAADACPGVARPFAAADGSIVRIRPACRPVSVEALRRVLALAPQTDRTLQLTSRGGLQLRGLPDPVPAAVRDTLAATGLLPSPAHELARNIVASPLSGLDHHPDATDIRELVAGLDRAICARPGLAELSGRFLFVLDDGRGDVIHQTFDLGALVRSDGTAHVFAGGPHRGWHVLHDDVVPLLTALAQEFVSMRRATEGTPWHVRELDRPIGPPHPDAEIDLPVPPERPLGAVGEHAVVGIPLALLTEAHADALAHVTDHVVVTPWRTLVVPRGAVHLNALHAAGFVVDRASSWSRLHACTGSPGCARSAIDTRALAHEIAGRMPLGSVPVHISGCERRCGTPAGAYIDLLAPRSADEAIEAARR